MSLNEKLPVIAGSSNELFKVKIGHLNSNRWEEYRDLRFQSLEEEPVAFGDVRAIKFNLKRLQENEWRSMLEGRLVGGRDKKNILVAEVDGKLV